MPYVIESDTTLPRVIAAGEDADGNQYVETERVAYAAGQVVFEDDIAPNMRERLESGDDGHLSALVRHVSEKEAQQILAEQAGLAPVAPEHEAEAEVLYQDGKDVLTREEVIESNPNGDAPKVEEATPDASEGREAANDSVRSTEVDEKRRGDGDAPGASSSDDKNVKELKKEAKELGVEGYSSMNRDELVSAIDAARAEQAQEPSN